MRSDHLQVMQRLVDRTHEGFEDLVSGRGGVLAPRGAMVFFGLVLLSSMMVMGCPPAREPEEILLKIRPDFTQMVSVWTERNVWVSLGTRGEGRQARIVVMKGDGEGHRASSIVDQKVGYYARDVVGLESGRMAVVGERAVPDSHALFGHPFYRGFWLELGPDNHIFGEDVRGVAGTTGWSRIVPQEDRWLLAGMQGSQAWFLARSSTGSVIWEALWDDMNRVLDSAGASSSVGVLGEVGPITRGQSLFRVINQTGQIQWGWPDPMSDTLRLSLVLRDGDRGWLLGGMDEQDAVVVALDSVGKERWRWRAGSSTERSRSPTRVAAMAVADDGRILVAVVRPFGQGEDGYPWVRIVSSRGQPETEARLIRPRTESGLIHIGDAAALGDGWLIAGGRSEVRGTFDGCVWRLNRNAEISWISAFGQERSAP